MPSHDDVQVGEESLQHVCGHDGVFIQWRKDPYRDARRDKFMARPCDQCGVKGGTPKAKVNKTARPATAAEAKAALSLVAKSEAPPVKPPPKVQIHPPNYLPRLLPVGVTVGITHVSKKEWQAVVEGCADVPAVAAETPDGALSKIAAAYCQAKGIAPVGGK